MILKSLLGLLMKEFDIISLKTYAKQAGTHPVVMQLKERLPQRIVGPCELRCDLSIEDHADYYLVSLAIEGALTITCQRCLKDFQHAYTHDTQLAVCRTDELAEKLMTSFECTVNQQGEMDLREVLTDDLHLFSPEKHLNVIECDAEMCQWIGETEA